jgi:hypothetical protein
VTSGDLLCAIGAAIENDDYLHRDF